MREKIIKIFKTIGYYILMMDAFIGYMFGFCPMCNNDAPELYKCPVCKYNKIDKEDWWWRFLMLVKKP